MDIATLYKIYLQHPVISTDSRSCPPGSLFFALKGDSFDGNLFAEKALNKASYAIVDDPDIKTDGRLIYTEDTLSTLQELACLHRKKLGLPVIGITGTNGKTTTKELIAAVLSTKYKTLYTSGNLNNHIGVPLTLLRLTAEHEIAVVEMGANHPEEIKTLSEIARPDYGIITNVGYAHLAGFGSFEGVIKTKGELYDFLRKTNGTLFIHNENEYLKTMAEGIHSITYGNDTNDFVAGEIIECDPFLRFKWKCANKTHIVPTRLVGSYNLLNLLAAITVGIHFGIPPEIMNEALSSYKPDNNRSQLKQTARNQLIIDAYNANPSSIKVALDNFSLLKAKKKMVILGDMLELGNESDSLHMEVIHQLENMKQTRVILCGEQFCSLKSSFACFPTVALLNEYIQKKNFQGYHILIKGSHGIHLEKVIELL